jgi:hypothetical protein
MTSNLFSLDLASTSAFRIRQGSSVPFYLKSDGNVGIGTTTPGYKLEVSGNVKSSTVTVYDGMGGTETGIGASSAGGYLRLYTGGVNRVTVQSSAQTLAVFGQDTIGSNYIQFLNSAGTNQGYIGMGAGASNDFIINCESANVPIRIFNGGSERMRITSGGDVGIGTADGPDDVNAKLHVYKNAGPNTVVELLRLDCGEDNHQPGKGGSIVWRDINVYTDTASITAQRAGNGSSSSLQFGLRNAEKMRITSGGEIQVGNAVGGSDTDTGTRINATQMRQSSSGTGAHDFHDFYRGTEGSLVRVGNIRTTGTTTAYNTSSDYRLKENVVEMTGALDRVSQLKPSRFNFISDGDTVDGFLAHEVQEVVPEAITGEKDAVDEEGNPDYQGIDQSKLVPLLVGAIQELKADNDSLKARIETLENN